MHTHIHTHIHTYIHTHALIHTHTCTPHYTEDLVHEIGDIGANATIYYNFNIIGLKIGTFRLVVGLSSDHVQMVTGEAEVRGWGCSVYVVVGYNIHLLT